MSDTVTGEAVPAAVFDAARAGNVDALAAALEGGVPADARNESGDSLLMLAAYHCRGPAVELLLAHAADASLANAKGQQPLAGVCWKGAVDIARALLDHGAEVDGSGGGMSPLMLAAMCGHREVVALLLEHGADPTRRSGNGHSARDLAANIKAQPVMDMLDDAIAAREAAPSRSP